MDAKYERLVPLVERQLRGTDLPDGFPAFALRLEGRPPHVFGAGEPVAAIVIKNRDGLAALSRLDLLAFAEAYMAGDIDLEGDLLDLISLRAVLSDRHPLRFLWRFVQPLIFGQVSRDRKWMAHHYDEEQDFYLLFLDNRHHCYSHGVFESDDEPLEDAMSRKLDFAAWATRLRPGDRVLDIGGGWGAFTEYAGRCGARVTSLTISESSKAFLDDLIARHDLDAEARLEHFYEHEPAEPYDAIVNLGVTEHLPDYARTLRHYRKLLKPGGRVYLDASAARERNAPSTFLERHIYRGNGTFLVLHEYLEAVAGTPFRLEGVWDDRHSYALTTRHWARNLDRHRDEVIRRWGKALYRKFRLYLWGCVDLFNRDRLQAYRLVLARPA